MGSNRSGIVTAIASFAFGVLAARFAAEPSNAVLADEKKTPEAFLSGGARSEKVLIEMLATLKTLDQRVAGIEELLQHSDTPRPSGTAVPKSLEDKKR